MIGKKNEPTYNIYSIYTYIMYILYRWSQPVPTPMALGVQVAEGFSDLHQNQAAEQVLELIILILI